MSLFTTEQQTSAYAKDPEYYRGSDFLLGLMGYKRNGQKSTFGKIKDVALPVIGGIAGTLIAGPAGTAVGAALGQGLNAASNAAASGLVAGAEDSQANVDADMSSTLARGQLGMSLGSLAGGIAGAGIKSGDSLLEIGKKVGPALTDNLGGVASGLAGAIAASGQPAVPRQRIRYFRGGGEASPGFAQRFAEERRRQGAGGRFMYQGKAYNTYYREEVDPATQRPLAEPERALPGFQEGEIPVMRDVDVSNIPHKAGVKLDGLNATIAGYINTLPESLRKQVLATSGIDSFDVHKRNSRHRTGDAIDLRYHPELHAYIQSDPVAHQLGLSVIDPNHGTAPHTHLQYTPQRRFAEGGDVAPARVRPVPGLSRYAARQMLNGAAKRVNQEMDRMAAGLPAQQDNTNYVEPPVDPTLLKSKQEAQPYADRGTQYVRDWISAQTGFGNMGLSEKHKPVSAQITNATLLDHNEMSGMMGGPNRGVNFGDTSYVLSGLAPKETASVAAHESTHQLQYDLSRLEGPARGNRIYDPNSPMGRTYENIKAAQKKANLTYQAQPGFENHEGYFRDPAEVHARIMQLRYEMGVVPGAALDRRSFDEQTRTTKSNALNELRQILTDDQIHSLMDPNKTVMNQRPATGRGAFYAATGGEVYARSAQRQPMRYNYAGLNFTIEQPSDYKLYGKGDREEDLIITDKKTGEYYGQMRLGERVFDQDSNLAMKAIMKSSYSAADKKQALGEHIYDELNTHMNPDDGSREFAGGNEVTPKPPTYGGRSLDQAYEQARANRSPSFYFNGKLYKSIEVDPMAGSWATPQARPNSSVNAELERYRNSDFYKQRTGTAASSPAPAVSPPAKTTAPASAGAWTKPSTSTPARKAAPAPAASKPAAKPAVTTEAVGRFARRFAMPETDTVGVLPPVPGGTGMGTKPVISDRVARSFDNDLSLSATKWEPTAEPAAKPVDTKSITGNLLDLGRVVTGAVMASKPMPTYQQPAALTAYQSEVAAKKNQGYSAEEWNTINGQIADNYASGVRALTDTFGGGTSAGVALAGLNRLNLTRAQQTQAAATGDVSRRAQNFAMYGTVVGQQAALDRQLYEEQAARVGADKQAGAALAQAGLQNLEQRQIYNENYGPNSTYNKLMDAQVERETEATNLLRKMRSKYVVAA